MASINVVSSFFEKNYFSVKMKYRENLRKGENINVLFEIDFSKDGKPIETKYISMKKKSQKLTSSEKNKTKRNIEKIIRNNPALNKSLDGIKMIYQNVNRVGKIYIENEMIINETELAKIHFRQEKGKLIFDSLKYRNIFFAIGKGVIDYKNIENHPKVKLKLLFESDK